jgi:tRNA threonylcarbamoyladenosine modification (KEOPS) complex  Pcc1 subunit
MQKSVVLAVTAFLGCVGTGAFAFAQGPSPQLEGYKPYTPTRLEWLAVELNAQMRRDPTPLSEYAVMFVPLEKEDAILIYVTYLPSVDKVPESRQRMNLTLDMARKVIAMKSNARGWSSWLKVKERVELAEPK